MKRTLPNILLTGTPGTGKSTLASELAEQMGLEWIDLSAIAKEHNYFDGYDDELNCHILDNDKVVNELEDQMLEGGKILEYHSCDFFPNEWFDIVFVLVTNNTVLYDRLARRGYTGKKLENNIQSEIFRVPLDEANEWFPEDRVHELKSDTPDDMETNIENVSRWIETYKSDNAHG